MNSIQFTDENVRKIFGYEDAESEPIERLKEYYLKKDIYERVITDLPLRILVGHKGTGKSALIKIAFHEEKEKGNLPILIKPDDIAELGNNKEEFLLKIRQWKHGLTRIIGTKVLNELGLYNDTLGGKLTQFGVKIVSLIYETASSINKEIDLQPAQQKLIDNFLRTKKIIVFIDDLDRGWEGKKDDISRISALLNCVRDMSNENEGINFKVALRSDVYFLVRTSDESTDKIETSIIWFKWTNHEIFVMLIKRILSFYGKTVDENSLLNTPQQHLHHYLEPILEKHFRGRGKWNNTLIYKILMSLIRKRPRDLVKLCTLAAHQAHENNSNIIKTEHLEAIFEEYSQGRIQDTINEYKSELPNIEKLILGMKPTKKEKNAAETFTFTTVELHKKINNIINQNSFSFANKRHVNAKELANFLYKINFITARKVLEDGTIQRKYFQENRYLSSMSADFGYDWEIHPAFRWALQPDNLNDILDRIGISND